MGEDVSSEQVVYIRPAAFPGAELLVARDSFRPWHVFHERYAFCACRTAAAGWRYRDREHFLNDGSVMLLEPGEAHRNTDVHKPADFKVFLVPFELFDDAARDQGAPVTAHFRFAQSEDPRLFRAIYRFSRSIESADTLLTQQTRFAACVSLLLEHAERRPPAPPSGNGERAVARVKACLQERFNEPVSLAELAALSGLNRFYLARAFTRHVGMPPHAYQIHVRIERATALLRAGVSPVDAAARVGFADQSHFTRHFKRIWRITPGAYARTRVGAVPAPRAAPVRAAAD
jgi:AraC-like DNA-binding protein